MKKHLTFLIILISILTSQAQEQYSRVKIDLRDKSIQGLAKTGIELDHGIFKKSKYFICELSSKELQKVKSAGYNYKLMVQDLQKEISHRREEIDYRGGDNCSTHSKKDYRTPDNFHLGSMAGNLTYNEMLQSLDSMNILYPNLISKRQVIDTFLTVEGRPIYWYKISDNPGTKENEPEILYTALHHAREPVSMMQMVYYMWYLLENYGKNDQITYLVNNREMYFIPCVNPDGYLFNEKTNPNGGGFWRKNRHDFGDEVYGVDLNRNYGYKWGYDNNGSSPDASSNTYRGTKEFSEEETKAVKYFCENHNFTIALNFHTYSNLLIHPWGYKPAETKDSTAFIAIGKLLTSENNYNSGLAVQTVGYPANGDSDDWMYGDTSKKNRIFVFTPEVGTEGFWPDKSLILQQCKENIFLNLTAASVTEPYASFEETTASIISKKDTLSFDITNTGLKKGIIIFSVKSINSDIVDYSEKIILDSFKTVKRHIMFDLDENVIDGTSFDFEITVDNGNFEFKDTIQKTYAIIKEQYISDCNDIDEWNTNGTWNTTNKDFVSAGYSITDSPDGNYSPNTKNELISKNKFYVPDDKFVFLSFKAKWDIEKAYDWTAVFAGKDLSELTALCGKNTVLGTKDQLPDEPVFDGTQDEWTDVNLDISNFAGDSIFIKFVMNSDPYVNGDGFYFDDLKFTSYGKSKYDKTSQINIYNIIASPNPSVEKVEFRNLLAGDRLIIKDIVGNIVFDKIVNNKTKTIQISAWQPGMYFYNIIRNGKKSVFRKLVVISK